MKAFRGPRAFLSNFFECALVYEGQHYPTAEHAFQCAKTTYPLAVQEIRHAATPGVAKRLGRKAPLRPDWEGVKLGIMEAIVRAKFSQPILRAMLVQTEGELIEENNHRDTFWGTVNGHGENHLGKILMKVRAEKRIEIKAEEAAAEIRREAAEVEAKAEAKRYPMLNPDLKPSELRVGQIVEGGGERWEILTVEMRRATFKVLAVNGEIWKRYLDKSKVYTLKRFEYPPGAHEAWEVVPEEMKRQYSQVLLDIFEPGEAPMIDIDS